MEENKYQIFPDPNGGTNSKTQESDQGELNSGTSGIGMKRPPSSSFQLDESAKKKHKKSNNENEGGVSIILPESYESDEADSLSKEANNFFHLFDLCQKIATSAVRFFFDSKVPGPTLEPFLQQHKAFLTKCQGRDYIFTRDQQAKLFPDVPVHSTDLDFTLLYKLIINLFTTIPVPTIPGPTIPAPTCGWGKPPSSGDINEGDDIERIRDSRNFLAHCTELEICDADFSNRWTDLSQVIDRLSKGSLSTDVESMKTKSFDKCIKHEIRKEQEQMREDFADMQKQLDANTNDIAEIMQNMTDDNQQIHNTQSKLSDQLLTYLATKLGCEWTQVVLVLGITQPEIEQIKMDNQGRSIEQIRVALFKWRNRQHNGPQQDTIKQLIRALQFPGRQDIIDDLKENYGIY